MSPFFFFFLDLFPKQKHTHRHRGGKEKILNSYQRIKGKKISLQFGMKIYALLYVK